MLVQDVFNARQMGGVKVLRGVVVVREVPGLQQGCNGNRRAEMRPWFDGLGEELLCRVVNDTPRLIGQERSSGSLQISGCWRGRGGHRTHLNTARHRRRSAP